MPVRQLFMHKVPERKYAAKADPKHSHESGQHNHCHRRNQRYNPLLFDFHLRPLL